MTESQSAGMGMFMMLFLFCLYMIPAIIAGARKHSSATAICIINLVFGWTGIIWFVCLFWACMGGKPVTITVVNQTPTPEQMDEYMRRARQFDSGPPLGDNAVKGFEYAAGARSPVQLVVPTAPAVSTDMRDRFFAPKAD
jgi:hypothetical protein